ncbi:osmotically inducible protein Y [Legionella beliardensis]|uniref:Osmotically inducible protein Y n=1 Tax=Legionella beliardensis TaxID=91822 RepID=A0A378I5Q1_9GAMM|nr:BON domain-containing protein [Legionella beliardensis]STX27804.1 osmotically inducible protein Y [Legionella beliardensis]
MQFLKNLILVLLVVGAVNTGYTEPNLKEIEQTISDSLITTKITAKFTKDSDLNPLKISVSTENGVVKLSGYVKNNEAFVKALRLANSTKGVVSIDVEDLEIKQVNTALTDTYITAKVEAAVLKAKVLDDESIPLVGINATTINGIVTLSGQVKSNKSIAAIIKRVAAIRGVKKVITHLKINKASS